MPSRRKKTTTDENGWTVVAPSNTSSKSRLANIIHAHDHPEPSSLTGDADTPDETISVAHNGLRLIKSNSSLEKQQKRFEYIHSTFQKSSCGIAFRKLVAAVHKEINDVNISKDDGSNIETTDGDNQTQHVSPKNWKCICLALGSLSEARMRVAPLYQLSVLLTIMEVWNFEQVVAYDPVFTDLDAVMLSKYNIHIIPSYDMNAMCKEDTHHNFIYLPHGSLQLSYDYMNFCPSIYLGNSVNAWALRLTGDDTNNKIDPFFETFKNMYNSQPFPEGKTYYDGTVFNELELYWRQSNGDKFDCGEEKDSHKESLENALKNLSIDGTDK